jgi:hypothetical protein
MKSELLKGVLEARWEGARDEVELRGRNRR